MLCARNDIINAFNEKNFPYNDLFKKHFNFRVPGALTKTLFEIKDAKENSRFVEEIRNRWSNLKDKIEEMSKQEIKNKKTNETTGIVSEILDFNKEIQKQRGSELKIQTPEQMLSRLPISLAQLKAGNKSEKLKNEIMYRSKKLTKNIYKSLVDII